jgi:hypothetical protein
MPDLPYPIPGLSIGQVYTSALKTIVAIHADGSAYARVLPFAVPGKRFAIGRYRFRVSSVDLGTDHIRLECEQTNG